MYNAKGNSFIQSTRMANFFLLVLNFMTPIKDMFFVTMGTGGHMTSPKVEPVRCGRYYMALQRTSFRIGECLVENYIPIEIRIENGFRPQQIEIKEHQHDFDRYIITKGDRVFLFAESGYFEEVENERL